MTATALNANDANSVRRFRLIIKVSEGFVIQYQVLPVF
jgi:hypothetical protein